ncbi:MAG: hypothetical protein KGL39_24710 [Patescibacteria group bacterium]|nr:hypothetical protein [Patescibacteria group bacterium]
MAAKKKSSKKPAAKQKALAKQSQAERSGDIKSGGNAAQSNLGLAGAKRREEEKARIRNAGRYLG